MGVDTIGPMRHIPFHTAANALPAVFTAAMLLVSMAVLVPASCIVPIRMGRIGPSMQALG